MLFIDGTWLYSNTPNLADLYGKGEFLLDFGRLPQVLAEEVVKQLGTQEVDVVRTNLFGSYASNYDLRDDDAVQRRLDFFSMLREEYHYEVEIFPINFRGRRLRKADRDPRDTFEVKEKCVDISLATSMMYYAAIPQVYDIALAVLGDQDFKPVLQHLRRLGKRVALASIRGSCSPELADPKDAAKVRDFDMIWLDDLLHRLELKYDRHQLECQSPMHKGDRKVWTTFHPRRGQKFYCMECRSEFTREKQMAQQEFIGSQNGLISENHQGNGQRVGETLKGAIKAKISDRGFGFIKGDDGQDYYFHLTDLQEGLEFEDLEKGLSVAFEVKKEPYQEKTGAAQNVRHLNEPIKETTPETELDG
jgi:cold shock CspA family protein/uncharacterized LabA/DUF88 family protein